MKESPRWLSDDEQDFWRLMLAARRKIDRGLEDSLQSIGELSSSEFAVLVSLSEAENRQMRLRELCASLNWDRSRTSHQITRMERRGLVHKAKSEGDARGVMVSLSQDGLRRLQETAPEHVETVRRLVFDHLDPKDIPALRHFFTGILNVDFGPEDIDGL